MMVFPEFNQELYDVVQVEVGYCKMFSHILEDFPTREDVKKMMDTSNLPVQTTVSTTVNTVLAGTAGPAPISGTGVGAGNGTGSGRTLPIYKCEIPSPASRALEQQKEAIAAAGGTAAQQALGGLG